MLYKESIYNIKINMREGKKLLYNSLSRGMCLLDKEDVEKVDSLGYITDIHHDYHFESDETMRYLVGQGFVLPKHTDELATVKNLYYNARNDPKSVNFIVCSTLACNFGCDYCFQGMDKPLEAMSQKVQDEVINLYQKLIEAKPEVNQINMVWYGGEPLMKPKVIYDLADRLIEISAKANISYGASMVSNGFMLSKTVAQELYKRGLRSVQVTLDGSEEFHDARRHLLNKKGTYNKILKNIEEWITEVPIHVNIRVNIDERNKDGIKHLMDDLVARGLSGKQNFKMYFSPVESNTEGCHNVADQTMKKMEYGQLEAELYKYAFEKQLVDLPYPPRFLGICSALRTNDYIMVPNGDVHKCWDTVSFPEKRIGTVFDTDALFERKHENYQLWDSFDPFENEICSSCKILPNCSSYCAHKFVYAKDSIGESVLPCPSIKYSLNERLVLRAEKQGFITKDDYDLEDIKTNPYQLTPRMHTEESMKKVKIKVKAEPELEYA